MCGGGHLGGQRVVGRELEEAALAVEAPDRATELGGRVADPALFRRGADRAIRAGHVSYSSCTPLAAEVVSRHWWGSERAGRSPRPCPASRGSTRCACRCDRCPPDAGSLWAPR